MPATLVFDAVCPHAPSRDLGAALHAEFLAIARALDPALSRALHDHGANKPYALSPLLTDETGRRIWRWSALSDGVREAMLGAAVAAPYDMRPAGHALTLRWLPDHPLARHANWHDLIVAPDAAARRYRLRFTSPTAFRRGGESHLMPAPTLMLASYLARWNALAPVQLPADTAARAESFLRLVGFDLRTREVRAGKVAMTGFEGTLELAVAAEAPAAWAADVGTLLAFAPYCGTGAKTALGFGQTEVTPLAELRRRP